MNEFLTAEFLTTFAGLVAGTAVLVQFTKSIIKKKFGDEFVRLYTFGIALLLSFIFTNNGYDAQDIALTIINAVVISISAMGGYELIADPRAEKHK